MSDLAPAGQSRRIFLIPRPVLALFAFLALVQAAESFVSPDGWSRFLAAFAFVPIRLTNAVDPVGAAEAVGSLPAPIREQALFLLGDGGARIWTMLTYAFVHGGWEHLLLNAVWLAAFGAPVARRIGGGRFFALFCLASFGGALAEWALQPYAAAIVVGASAGISGLMGAATRFVFQPGGALGADSTNRLAPQPALSLAACARDSRVATFVLFWFIANTLFGVLAAPMGLSPAPVAWQAHIGGFLVGLLTFALFDRSRDAASISES